MSGQDHDVCPPARRVAAVVLTTVLAAAARAADRAGTRPPTTSIRTTGVPAATSHGGSAAPPARNLRGLIAYSTLRADGTETIVTPTRTAPMSTTPGWSGRVRRVVA